MTEEKPTAGKDSSPESKGSDETGNEAPSKSAEGTTDNDENKHIVRILGTYSLLTFFEQQAQEKFFETITSRAFESIFDPDPTYATDTDSFLFSREERQFELRMTNMGFIREGFWREAFPPIFQLKGYPKAGQTWQNMLPACTRANLTSANGNSESDKRAEALFYEFCLGRLAKELSDVGGQQEIHIGLNRFGIVNIGITIKWDRPEDKSFEALCKDAYKKVSHLQEDPFEDLKREADALTAGDQKTLLEKVSRALDTRDCPRLVVSYFQVLAITTIHKFLHDKLEDKSIGGFEIGWLANPWEIRNQLENSTRKGLPPLRHVVFMYQLVHGFSDKATFLDNNWRALLTLGHNVGWSPSDKSPFPAFDSRRARLKDSSLLETSCCLIFPQGLVVVIPPDLDGPEGVQTIYPGGMHDNTSSSWVTYREYWKLIFKLFIRVAEARLLIGMVNRYLTDLHQDFLRCPRTVSRLKTCRDLSKIHDQLIHVGLIIQRTSGRVITPEVTRYSFVRRKLADFLGACPTLGPTHLCAGTDSCTRDAAS